MIRKITFSNFYSFNDEQIIDFTASKKNGYSYHKSKDDIQTSKIAAFIGSNASGKTNVLRLFSFLRFFLQRSAVHQSNEQESLTYKTFFNNDRPSSFLIEFETENVLYKYKLRLQKGQILEESLRSKDLTNKDIRLSYVFKREKTIKFYEDHSTGMKMKFLDELRDDISLIPYMKASLTNKTIDQVYNYFSKFNTNLNERGQIYNPIQQIEILERYIKNDDIKAEMEEVIKNFDIGLSSFDINKIAINKTDYRIQVEGLHKTKETRNNLDFIYESRGTQALFFVLGNIIHSIKNDSVIIIDELETGFHPEAVNQIINYFLDENYSGKAQLLFTSHAFEFINKLDMHQIYLTEKNDNSVSSCKRLKDVEGIRSDDNFLKKYMASKYGAFPNISI